MKKIFIMLMACVAGAHAETKTWLGGDGNFATAANWSDSSVPVDGDDVVIANAAVSVVETDSSFFELNSIELDGSAQLTISNNADRAYLGTTDGDGTLVKEGSGRLQWETSSRNHYGHSATIVNNGTITLGTNTSSAVDAHFGTFTINAPGIVETIKNGNTNFRFLWGDGTLTNTLSSGSNQQLRIIKGPCEFSGQICGKIRYYSQGEVYLTGTNSTFVGNFAIHSSGGPGITGAKKIGFKGLPSSIGIGSNVDIREHGGRFRYLGTGEITDKDFLLYPSANRAVIDGGEYGGVTFNGIWKASRNVLNRVAILGSNASPCVFNGTFYETTQNGTNYSTYIAKEGIGTWIFKDNANRSNRGVVAVREGTLQFESIAEVGEICSLGRSDLLFEDVINTVTNGYGVSYAFTLGTASTVGTLEYIGSAAGSCSSRKLVLQGDGRLKSDAASLSFDGGVESLTTGAKTLYLAGSGTNALGFVADGAGTVGITKEGSGTWKLSATNTFSGPLAVKAGQLILDKRGYTYYKFNMDQRYYDVSGG